MREFTFGSYNLHAGGFDDGRDERLRHQLALLADLGADAWALQECVGWRASGCRALFLAEQMLGLRGFLVPSLHECDLAVFVRQSAGLRVVAERHEQGHPYWHAVACIVIETAWPGIPLHLVSADLAPSSPWIRRAEAEALALIAQDGLVIAGGDWKAMPATDPEPAVNDGIDPGRARRELDRSAAYALEEAGFIDTAAHMGDLRPTVGHVSGLRYRRDRVYATLPSEAIVSYQVVTEYEPASSHRPVMATFDLDAVNGRSR